MGGRRTSLPAEISKVRARVERWRGEREGWSRMPGELWEAAVDLARSHGVSRVSRELRLDYTSLKKRVMEVSGPGGLGKEGGEGCGGFVEMDPAGLAGVFGAGGALVEAPRCQDSPIRCSTIVPRMMHPVLEINHILQFLRPNRRRPGSQGNTHKENRKQEPQLPVWR